MTIDVNSLVFVGLNNRVAALDNRTGETMWTWGASKPWTRAYVSLLLLNDRQLIASVNGYTYCLDPRTGRELWANDLPNFGNGVASIAAAGGHSPHNVVLAAATDDAARQSSD
jgi:hypothetical protein